MSSSDSDQSEMAMEVMPVLATDQFKPVDKIRTRTFFIVDEQLDEDVLKTALDTLIRNHWRKLGARLVKQPRDGALEWHLPKTFNEKYALFRWSSKEYDHSIDKIGLPKETTSEKGIVLLPPPEALDKWFRPSDWPFEHTDEPDAPMLLVHMSIFTDDTTAIAISLPHAFGDQYGLANIMKAWLGLARGELPPPMVGFNENVIPGKDYSEYKKEEIVRKGRMRIRRFGEFQLLVLGVVPEMALRPKEENHSLFIPVQIVESMKERYTKALKEQYGTDPGLTNGDVLTGILTKFSQIHKSSKRKISLSQTVNLRRRVPKLGEDAAGSFTHNAMHYSTARFKMEPTTPVAELAYQNRQALKQALDPKDIEAGMAVMREMVRRGQSIVICEPFERFYHVTNWSSAWRPLDFSSVVKKKEGVEGVSRRPKLLVLGEGKPAGADLRRYSSTIMCKTEQGYWINFAHSVKGMNMVREYFKKDPMLEHL